MILLSSASVLLVALVFASFVFSVVDVSATYYDLLQIDRGASVADIKRAYRQLALQYHPDKATDDDDAAAKSDMFIRLANAYEVLSSPSLRARYHWLLSVGEREYSERDWTFFDETREDFSRRGAKTFRVGSFSFNTAQHIFDAERAAAEAEAKVREGYAIVAAVVVAAACALIPTIYVYYTRSVEAHSAAKRRSALSGQLKANAAIAQELLAERERAQRDADAAEAENRRELRAAQAAAADRQAETNRISYDVTGAEDDGDVNVSANVATAYAFDDAQDETLRSARRSGEIFSCEVCAKKFKSKKQSTHAHTRTLRHMLTDY